MKYSDDREIEYQLRRLSKNLKIVMSLCVIVGILAIVLASR